MRIPMRDAKEQPMYSWPEHAQSAEVLARLTPPDDALPAHVVQSVRDILAAVRARGDAALIEYTQAFDDAALTQETLRVSAQEIAKSAENAPQDLRDAIDQAIQNIRAFHTPQRQDGYSIEGPGSAKLEFLWRPVASAALYVPGGRAAYPSTVLMNAIPAQVAGVERLVVLTVPGMVESNPAVAYALQALELTEVYRVAGAQSVAAAAYGTETIAPVDVIVGPGNAYVAAAKDFAFGGGYIGGAQRETYGRVGAGDGAGPSEGGTGAAAKAEHAWGAPDVTAAAAHGEAAR